MAAKKKAKKSDNPWVAIRHSEQRTKQIYYMYLECGCLATVPCVGREDAREWKGMSITCYPCGLLARILAVSKTRDGFKWSSLGGAESDRSAEPTATNGSLIQQGDGTRVAGRQASSA